MPDDRSRQDVPDDGVDNTTIFWIPVKYWIICSYVLTLICVLTSLILCVIYVKDPFKNQGYLTAVFILLGLCAFWLLIGAMSEEKRKSIRKDLRKQAAYLREMTHSARRLFRNYPFFRDFMSQVIGRNPHRWMRGNRPIPLPPYVIPEVGSQHRDLDYRIQIEEPVSSLPDPGTPTRTRRELGQTSRGFWGGEVHPNIPHLD